MGEGVQVGAADPTGSERDEGFTGLGGRIGKVLDDEALTSGDDPSHRRSVRPGVGPVGLTGSRDPTTLAVMSIDFTLPADVEEVRLRIREFMDAEVRPAEEKLYANATGGEPDRREVVAMIIDLRQKAKGVGGVAPPHADRMGRARTRDHRDGVRVR